MIQQTVSAQLARIKSKVKSWFGRKQKFEPPKSQHYQLETSDAPRDPDRIRPTKAYADQRQKSPRNRKHKPSKAMRRVYHLQ
jgi:hypothetical protein